MERDAVNYFKNNYPPGAQVEMVRMEDVHAIPPGTKGVVQFVDDIGTIHVDWENGRRLGVCPDVDVIEKLDTAPARASVTEKLKSAEKNIYPASAPDKASKDKSGPGIE